jgi:hypothetical protein
MCDGTVNISTDKLFEYTTARIDREVDTSRARITRMLYVSGFLLSALALVAELGENDPISLALLIACPCAGSALSLSSFFALQASQTQRNEIKKFWERQDCSADYPPFYASQKTSNLARRCMKAVPIVFFLIWISILITVVLDAFPTSAT